VTENLAASTARGSRAQQLLDDELLKEAFASLDAEYIKAWREAPARDDDMRQRLWQAVNVLAKVRDHLIKIASDGRLAREEIERLADKEKRRARVA
jgi:hypothetical protein